MERTKSCSAAATLEVAPQESMKDYVIRRAFEVKQYQRVAELTGVNFHWLQKLALGSIHNPNYNDIETLEKYYRALDTATAL